MNLVEDPESGELVGPAGEVEAFLEAREPAYRIWTEGEIARAEVLGGDPCLLVTDRPSDERALLEIAAEQVPMALVVWLRLRPRPVPRASSSSWHRPPPPSWSASWWR